MQCESSSSSRPSIDDWQRVADIHRKVALNYMILGHYLVGLCKYKFEVFQIKSLGWNFAKMLHYWNLTVELAGSERKKLVGLSVFRETKCGRKHKTNKLQHDLPYTYSLELYIHLIMHD